MVKRERSFRIKKTYSGEPLDGASFYGLGTWLPIEQAQYGDDYRGGPCKFDGWAVRIEYTTDEGFKRTSNHDRVFLLDASGTICVASIPTEFFRIGKPGDRARQQVEQKSLDNLLDPKKAFDDFGGEKAGLPPELLKTLRDNP